MRNIIRHADKEKGRYGNIRSTVNPRARKWKTIVPSVVKYVKP
jgi:hypothetical protein